MGVLSHIGTIGSLGNHKHGNAHLLYAPTHVVKCVYTNELLLLCIGMESRTLPTREVNVKVSANLIDYFVYASRAARLRI